MNGQSKTVGRKRVSEVPVGEILLRRPLMEVLGNNRVMLENHKGIIEYGDQKICVKVSFGCVKICGNRLELAQMTSEKLIVLGDIHSVSFNKRGDR